MTPEYIASKLSLLPQFKVEDIDHEPEKYGRGKTLLGRFSEPPPFDRKDYRASFFLPDLRNICGRLHEEPDAKKICMFQQHDNWPTDITDTELLTETLAYFGHYGKNHVELALDQAINWTEQPFSSKPSLQFRFEGANGKPYLQAREYIEGEPVPEGATIVEAGWGHVHCSFCWESIGPGEIGSLGTIPTRAMIGCAHGVIETSSNHAIYGRY